MIALNDSYINLILSYQIDVNLYKSKYRKDNILSLNYNINDVLSKILAHVEIIVLNCSKFTYTDPSLSTSGCSRAVSIFSTIPIGHTKCFVFQLQLKQPQLQHSITGGLPKKERR